MITALFCICLLTVVTPTTINRIVYSPTQRGVSSNEPIRLIYVDGLSSWWGNLTIPAALGVPGFTATPLPYNYIALAFWTYPGSAVDGVGIWANIASNMGPNQYGTTNKQIQTTLKKNFTNNGVKLIVSAFGSTQSPTSAGINAVDCATKLAAFVIDNQFDGVDIDWEDTPSFKKGDSSGQNWLITLTTTLHNLLPAGSIITHAPQAPYFGGSTLYPKNAYLAVDKAVGSYISFYNVQFYNQGVGMYDSAQGLFNVSGGWAPFTSINQINASGVPLDKIVLGKPAIPSDGNNGWLSAADLNAAIVTNYPYNKWNAGLMFWQLIHDLDGSICNGAGKGIITQLQEDIQQSTS